MSRVEMSFLDNSENEANFNLYRDTSSPVEASSDNQVIEPDSNEGTGEVIVADTTAEVDTIYYYGVTSSNSRGESPMSNEIEVDSGAFAMSESGSASETLNVSVEMQGESNAGSIAQGRYIDLSISTPIEAGVEPNGSASTDSKSFNRNLASPKATVFEGVETSEEYFSPVDAGGSVGVGGGYTVETNTYTSENSEGGATPLGGYTVQKFAYVSTEAQGGVDADGFKVPTGNFRNVRVYPVNTDGETITAGEWIQTRGLFPTAGKVLQDSQGRAYADMWLLDAAYDDLHIVADSGVEGFDYVWYPSEESEDPLIARSDRASVVVFERMVVERTGGGGGLGLSSEVSIG